MATEDYWADPVIDRERTPLERYFPTLDAVISKDDPVRLVDEVLAEVDWSDWEFHYPRQRGQPPRLSLALGGLGGLDGAMFVQIGCDALMDWY